jgi:AraC-like DNA-binding protein
MGLVAAQLDGRAAAATLRRTLPRGQSLVICRNAAHLDRTMNTRLLDAVVIGAGASRTLDLPAMRDSYPRVPLVVYGVFRTEDGPRAMELDRLGVAALVIEGIDDPIVGDRVDRVSLTRRRFEALRDGPRVLRLTEPLQLDAWEALVRSAGRPPATDALARRLAVSREHLSRRFGAGGAPNLKRVVDFLQVTVARELLGNPAYSPLVAARLLGYSTVTHLRTVVRRVVRLPLDELPRASVPDLLRRFHRSGMRARG